MTQVSNVKSKKINYDEILKACSLQIKTMKNPNIADNEKCLDILKKYFIATNPLVDINQSLKDFKNKDTGWTPLLCCCFMEFTDGVCFLLDQGANPNIVGKDGKSPLAISSIKNKISIVNRLIKKGAKINYIDFQGKTALMEACEKGNPDTVKLLLESHADIKIKSKANKSCIDFAMEAGNYNIVKHVEHHYFDSILDKKDSQERQKTKI